MPVLALGDSWLGDVDAHLTMSEGVEELGEAASGIHIHLVVIDGFLLWEVREIGGHELVAEAALREGDHVDAVLVGCCIGTLMDDVNDFTKGGFMCYRYKTVTTILSWNSLNSIKLTTMFVACESPNHFIYQIINVEQLHFHTAVVDLYGQVVGNVVAEGGYG